jgi:hypothetical protein
MSRTTNNSKIVAALQLLAKLPQTSLKTGPEYVLLSEEPNPARKDSEKNFKVYVGSPPHPVSRTSAKVLFSPLAIRIATV